jgi:hypothetical protein
MDGYRSHPDGTVARNSSGPSLFGGMGFEFGQTLNVQEYEGTPFSWGSSTRGERALALAVLVNCLGEEDRLAAGSPTVSAALHHDFADEVVGRLAASEPFDLPWVDVMRWLDLHLNRGEPGVLTRLSVVVPRFEAALLKALDLRVGDERRRYMDPGLWSEWNLDEFFHTAIAKRTFRIENLPRLIGCLMDVKFKLYCLLEVDLPAYAVATDYYGINEADPAASPHGLAIRLSSEATIIVKVRSIWESVMNAVFAAEGVRRPPSEKAIDPDGFTYRSKSKAFFKFVADRPQWSGLASFQTLIADLDNDRTPEVHLLSQLRGDFVAGQYRPLLRTLNPLNGMLHYVWDHLAALVFFDVGPIYDVTTGAGMHIDLTGAPQGI